MKKKVQVAQGDVWFESAKIPKEAQPIKGSTFAKGEGHHLHRASAPMGVQLFETNGARFCRVLSSVLVEHVTPDGRPGEHRPVALPIGDYAFGQVQEWDYLAEMAREVID